MFKGGIMKKVIFGMLFFCGIVSNLFGWVLPTGDYIDDDYIESSNAYMEEGRIVYQIKLMEDQSVTLTTPLGKVNVYQGTSISFYDSGALMCFCPAEDNEALDTPVGTIKLYGGYDTEGGFLEKCYFYESGCPEFLHVVGTQCLTVGKKEYTTISDRSDIRFYDSGDKNQWPIKEIHPTYYPARWREPYVPELKVTYVNKIGSFEILSYDVEFFENGFVKRAYVQQGPKKPVFIKGKKIVVKEPPKIPESSYDSYNFLSNWIEFYENESIKSLALNEGVKIIQDGLELLIPAKSRVDLYKNGTIKKCRSEDQTIIKIGKKEYTVWDGFYVFNQNGSLKAFSIQDNFGKNNFENEYLADSFYEDGTLKRIILDYHQRYEQGDIEVQPKNTYILYGNTKYYFQKSDSPYDISMIYFDQKGKPAFYTTFKTDPSFGYILFDEDGYPVENPDKKKFEK